MLYKFHFNETKFHRCVIKVYGNKNNKTQSPLLPKDLLLAML